MSDDDRIASIVGEWQERSDRGEDVDPEAVIAEHPDLANELRTKFEALARLDATRAGEARSSSRTRLRELPLDRYADFRPAGEGGMGIVYRALDTDLNREVAFKVVRPDREGETSPDPSDMTAPLGDTAAAKAFEMLTKRFLQEAWVTGGLNHPGIAPVYELGQTQEGVPYYTMRFVRGERTLGTAIEEVRERPFEERVQLLEPFLRVCDTIGYAHAQGVVHRDLKPVNVALGEFGEVVVLDWGLARLKGERAGLGEEWQQRMEAHREASALMTVASVGTPGYMAPEALSGAAAELSDVYSLGSILYEILTGRLPHRFDSMAEFARKVKTTPKPPRAVDPDVPEALSMLCTSALTVEPAERLGSATALADGIRGWQAQSALDREVESLLRDAEVAMQAAEDASEETRLRQADRAAAALAQVATKQLENDRARALSERAAALREQGIRERERASTRRLLVRGGVGVLAVAVIAALLAARAIEKEAREAEIARDVAQAERNAKAEALEEAERERDAKAGALDEVQRERDAKAQALEDARRERDEKSRALDEVLRLSDAKKVRDLLAEASSLWPIRSDVAPRMAGWLDQARAVMDKQGDHQKSLAEVRARAVGDPTTPETAGERDEEQRARVFATDEDAWRHEVLSDLVRNLRTLATSQAEEIEGRHRAASGLREASIDDHAEAWAETIERIAASAGYGGLRLAFQEGLVPLGPDPDSGLFEFAHLGSGTIPTRDPETRRLAIAEDGAIVLVLIPGGSFLMGAQAADPDGDHFDPEAEPNESPLHDVTLSPFFLAKHEVTQAQWAAMTGGLQPSQYKAEGRTGGRQLTRSNPVEQVSWEDADLWLGRHRLALPTEAQWEYACRAGIEAPWIIGRDVSRLGEVANIADAYLKANGGPPDWAYTDEVDDGHVVHAPVGSFSPNPFGLFDVHGNVYEWCRDLYQPYPADHQADPLAAEGSGARVSRGGSWGRPARGARSARRGRNDAGYRSSNLGVRAARTVTP